jgi:hypothetical protein
MKNSDISTSGPQPERPSPMMQIESPISFRRSIGLMTPRWLKRLSRRGHSA